MLTKSFLLDIDNNEIYKGQQYRDNKFIVWLSQTKNHKYIAVFNISEHNLTIPEKIKIKYGLLDKNINLWNDQEFMELDLVSHDVAIFEVE